MKNKISTCIITALFAIGLMLCSAKRLRFLAGGIIGPSEILILLSSLWIIITHLKDKTTLIPSRYFTIGWSIFWLCALAGCITRTYVNDIAPPGFKHNLLAFIYLCGITYIFLIEFKTSEKFKSILNTVLLVGTPFYLIPYILAKLGTAELFGRPIYFAGWTGPRLEGFTMNPNQMGFIAISLIAISLYLFAKTRSIFWRTTYTLCFIINIILCFETRSSSALAALFALPLIFIISLLLSMIKNKNIFSWKRVAVFACICIALSSIVMLWQGTQVIERFSTFLNQNSAAGKLRSSWNVRRPLYTNSFKILRSSPIWGYGFGGQVGHFKNFGGVTDAYECHNSTLDIAVTGGLLSMLIWLLLWLRAGWSCFRNNEVALLTSLGIIFVFSLGNNIMRQPLLWIILLGAIVIANHCKKIESSNDA